MLENIICFLMTNLGSDYFVKIFPLVELIQKGENLRPAQYIAKGQFQDVTKFDNYNGMAYFRQTSSERINKLEPKDGDVPCGLMLQFEYPLRLVCCIPKSKLKYDDAFSDNRIGIDIAKLITRENGLLNQQLKANFTSFIPTEIITNNKKVLDDEYQGYDIRDINFAFAYLAIDFTATVQIKASCITSECDYEYA